MKISSIFAILTASAILAACDFLDEYNPNSVTVGNYYTSEEDIEDPHFKERRSTADNHV